MNARYERLAGSADPLLREIGEQLRLGQVTPAGLLAIPEYREVIRRGLALLARRSGTDDERHRLGA